VSTAISPNLPTIQVGLLLLAYTKTKWRIPFLNFHYRISGFNWIDRRQIPTDLFLRPEKQFLLVDERPDSVRNGTSQQRRL
jgi:hypothetical protein